MSLLANQTSINPTTDFFLNSGGGESTVPSSTGIAPLGETAITQNQTALLANIPLPVQYNVSDTLIYQVTLQFQSIAIADEGAVQLELSVAYANEDVESSGNQNYYVLFFGQGTPTTKISVSLTDVVRASVETVAIRLKNLSPSTITIGTTQFIRSTFQFVSANSI
jgi:mevalonate kinase